MTSYTHPISQRIGRRMRPRWVRVCSMLLACVPLFLSVRIWIMKDRRRLVLLLFLHLLFRFSTPCKNLPRLAAMKCKTRRTNLRQRKYGKWSRKVLKGHEARMPSVTQPSSGSCSYKKQKNHRQGFNTKRRLSLQNFFSVTVWVWFRQNVRQFRPYGEELSQETSSGREYVGRRETWNFTSYCCLLS